MAKTKRRTKIDKEIARELKQPDEFITVMGQFQEWANNHRPAVITGLVAIFAVVALANGVASYAKSRTEKHRTDEYQALKGATETLFQAKDKEAAIKKIDALIEATSDRTDRARLYVTKGEMLMEVKDYPAAAEAFEGGLAHARNDLVRNLAATGLASAEIAQGKEADAAKRLAGIDGVLSEAARVEQIRLALAQHNEGEARAIFNQLEGDQPDSPAITTARQLLERHGIVLEGAKPTADAPAG